MQARGQALSYAAAFPQARDEIVWVSGERAGRVLLNRAAAEWHLVDIALLPVAQGQGIGSAIVGRLCAEAVASKSSLTLMVREDNPAKRLYERSGLRVVATDGIDTRMMLLPEEL